MRGAPWIRGLTLGASAGLAVAVAMTFADWRLNPGGIFHDAGGAHWGVVAETALSWFWPVTAAAGAVATAVFYGLERRG